VTAKNVARPSRNQKSEYLAHRRKGRKEIRLPDLPFLAFWRDAELLSRLALQRGYKNGIHTECTTPVSAF
jgi:hypothetical protein